MTKLASTFVGGGCPLEQASYETGACRSRQGETDRLGTCMGLLEKGYARSEVQCSDGIGLERGRLQGRTGIARVVLVRACEGYAREQKARSRPGWASRASRGSRIGDWTNTGKKSKLVVVGLLGVRTGPRSGCGPAQWTLFRAGLVACKMG